MQSASVARMTPTVNSSDFVMLSFFFFFFGFQPKATRAGDEKHRKKSTWPHQLQNSKSEATDLTRLNACRKTRADMHTTTKHFPKTNAFLELRRLPKKESSRTSKILTLTKHAQFDADMTEAIKRTQSRKTESSLSDPLPVSVFGCSSAANFLSFSQLAPLLVPKSLR